MTDHTHDAGSLPPVVDVATWRAALRLADVADVQRLARRTGRGPALRPRDRPNRHPDNHPDGRFR